jgi:YYY domain-containing protein
LKDSLKRKRAVSDYFNAILWFIFVEILGLISAPLAGMIGDGLADKGYSASRILGIMLIVYMSWISSYLLGFNRITILISVLTLGLISTCVYKKKRYFPKKKTILTNELIFAAAFFFFLVIRIHIPIIYMHEKFMDFAFLNAVMRTSSFPPADPWFAGGSLDFYYYFGYLSVGVLGKLCSVEPSILFNLAIALIFALCFNLFFGIGYNLTSGKIKYGLMTAVSGALLGNIQGLIEFINVYLVKEPSTTVSTMGYYWSSSRVIPYTINEFPYFSFIHGDLHSHMLAIPFQLLIFIFLLNVYFKKKGNRIFENTFVSFIFSLSLGFLFPTNSWDFPVYFILTVSIILIFYYGYYIRTRDLFGSVLGFFKTNIFISAFSLLPYLPFYLAFNPKAAGGFDFVGPELRTTVDKFLILFGFFLFLIFSFLISRLGSGKKIGYLLIGVVISSYLSRWTSIPLLVVLLPLLALSLYSFLRDLPDRSPAGFVSLLIAIASFIALFCELIFLDDPITGNFARMNTVFKLYMHLWIFLAIAATYAYYDLNLRYKTSSFDRLPLKLHWKKAWTFSLILLVISCSFFPIVSTYTRIKNMNALPSLDGMEYMRELDRGDYNAIRWMQENIEGTPAILEASDENSAYTYISRVSANTGLPTVLGWTGHEFFWGRDPREVRTRISDVNTIYRTGSIKKALELINKYNVSYVYIGNLERQLYGVKTDKFDDETYFELVYLGSVKIYKVKKAHN